MKWYGKRFLHNRTCVNNLLVEADLSSALEGFIRHIRAAEKLYRHHFKIVSRGHRLYK